MPQEEINNQGEKQNLLTWFRKIADAGGRFVDYKMGFIGAGVMAVIVFGINYFGTDDLFGATTAALKQGSYTAIFGGFIMKSCEYLATSIKKRSVALAAAIIIPSLISIGLTFGVHSLKGTPKPVESTIPTALLVIPSTAVWGYMKLRRS
jgi:hypothetical protein